MRCIVTDGVFSMDGDLTPLDKIYQLAQKYNAQIILTEVLFQITYYLGEVELDPG